MANDWSAGLKDQDELSSFPSATSPLSAMGIDPDEARANPGMLRFLSQRDGGGEVLPQAQAPKESPSSAAAGKVGGAGDTSAPPASPAPAESSPTDAHGFAIEGLSQLSKGLKDATDSSSKMSTEAPADVTRLTAQQEKLEQKTPLRDEQGNMLPQYKPSVGSRIWRGVRGGLEGLAIGGIPGALVGTLDPGKIPGNQDYGAPNKQYSRAEDARQQQLGGTQEELKTAMQSWKDVNDARKAKASEERANATLGKDLTTGATGLINAENRPEKEEEKTKAKLELSQKEFEQRTKQLNTDPTLAKLSPLNKAYYLAEGKVYQPRESTEADVLAQNIARASVIWKNGHNGQMPKTVEEFNQLIASAKGDLNKGKGAGPTEAQIRQVNDKKAAGIEKANQAYATANIGEKEALAEYNRQLQEVQNAYEADVSTFGGPVTHQVVTVDPQGQVKWTPQAEPAAVAPPATGGKPNQTPKTPPPGATHTARSKADGKLHWTNGQGTADFGVAE